MSATNKKRVVIYTENYVYGGLERTLFDIINNIDREKYEISLLYNQNPDFDMRLDRSVSRPIKRKSLPIYTVVPYLQRLERRNYPRAIKSVFKAISSGLGYLFFICNIFLLRGEFSRSQIDTLYIINGGYPGAGSCLAAVIAGRHRRVPRIVLLILSYPFHRKLGIPERFVDSLISKLADIIVTNSAVARNGMIELRNFPPAKLLVIHTGVSEDQEAKPEAATTIRERYSIPSSAKVVGMVGVFEPYKGHTYLLEAIPLVKKKFSNVRFVLVGDGRTKKELEKLVQSRGLSEDVIFAGYYPQDQIIDVVGAFDIFVLPSLHEGFPYAILDAMLLGKPVIATEVGGIPEQINNGVSGILLPPRDSEALANAIIYLLTNEKKAKEMGLEARKKVRNDFTLKSMVSSMEELL
jgi:glycosyltransferase involved in cell wall biosynthesis